MTSAGLYGTYGGRYVPETLIPALDELEQGWREALDDESFHTELDELGRTFAGRPTPLTRAERFAPGKRLYLKREDLLHTGAHKLNNALGQAVLARRLGKRRIVAETGAGQHGVATATVCARFGFECVVSTFVIQSRIASLVASFSVRVPKSTGRTSAPSSSIRSTLGRCRRMSSSPM